MRTTTETVRPIEPAKAALALGRIALPYLLAAVIAYVFLRYLPYKFTSESALFQTIEDWAGYDFVEPYFRYLTGSIEALASLLLFIPGLQLAGAGLALGTMTGAILLHVFTPLGIDPYSDGAQLFKQACTVWVCALAIIVMRRDEILPFLRLLVTDRRALKIWQNV